MKDSGIKITAFGHVTDPPKPDPKNAPDEIKSTGEVTSDDKAKQDKAGDTKVDSQ